MPELYQKIDNSFLLPLAQRFARWAIPFIPTWVKPNHITVLGFLMIIIASVSFYLASFNKLWLLVAPLPIFLHWLTDNLDGELARARNQTSDRGFFLDLFLDNVGLTAIALGLAFASYTRFELWAVAHMITLLRTILILFWIVLKRQFPLPPTAEGRFILITLTLLTFYWHGSVLQIGSYYLGWFDLFIVLLLPISFFEMVKSAVELYRQLEGVN